jgi:DNA-directed RNA polymerase subunit beta
MSQEIETLMPHDLINAKPVSRGGQGVLRQLAALAVHGPDEPALRGHAQAPSLGARAGRPHPRARGLRGARRPRHALRPHLPDRDAGRSEHRPHRVAVDLRARQRVRLRRDALPQGRGRQVTDEVQWFSALEEEGSTSPRRTRALDEKGKFRENLVSCRALQRRLQDGPREVTLMDVSPNQLVSVAASLIPFLEHDDANRALMGSNMQRQAVPLVRTARAARRHRHGGHRRARLGRVHRGQARRRRRERRRRRASSSARRRARRRIPDIYTWSSSSARTRTPANQKPIVRRATW